MKKVLISIGSYLPGTKSGGPVKSIANIVDSLKEEFEFYVLAFDRDIGDDKPYKYICPNKWNKRDDGTNVYYMSPESFNIKTIRKVLKDEKYDLIYLNSFFSILSIKVYLSILIEKLYKNTKILWSPRGEFSKGALGIHKYIKSAYIRLFKLLLNKSEIIWQATSKNEEDDIFSIFKNPKILNIENIGTQVIYKDNKLKKYEGYLKMVYIARISEMKNLIVALEILQKAKGEVIYDIYGPMEDKLYWSKCEKIIEKMPSNVKVKYKGKLESDEVSEVFPKYHAFFMPTKGENFGHSIFESLSMRCIPIISDRTPWRNLEENNVGWDICLEDKEKFIEAINFCVNMNQNEYDKFKINIEQYMKKHDTREKSINVIRTLINSN